MHGEAVLVKIYHGPQNIGGMAGVLATAQRDIGFLAMSCCYTTGNFRYKSDQEITLTNNYRKRFWELWKLLIKTLWRYDIFQFYFGESITGPFLLELALLKILNKKIFFYFCGCDIRDSKLTIEKYTYSACKECWPMACSANQKNALRSALKYADAIFVSTPDLIEFIPGSVLLPQPIDINTFDTIKKNIVKENNQSKVIKIAHAPSNRKIKGTRHVEEAISALKTSGYLIELLLVENLSYEEALHKCANADIVIDQLLIGSYGQYSVEMMALGKPVICYLRDDLLHLYSPDLPIVNANPSNLIEVLKNLLDHKEVWEKLGHQGVKYVQQNHDSKVIAKKLIEYYK
jgi:glycosyltransferase involved in cell wall biosynthesis